MKSITLTKKHKTKLLEMCKALFPEKCRWHIGYSWDDSDDVGYLYSEFKKLKL